MFFFYCYLFIYLFIGIANWHIRMKDHVTLIFTFTLKQNIYILRYETVVLNYVNVSQYDSFVCFFLFFFIKQMQLLFNKQIWPDPNLNRSALKCICLPCTWLINSSDINTKGSMQIQFWLQALSVCEIWHITGFVTKQLL